MDCTAKRFHSTSLLTLRKTEEGGLEWVFIGDPLAGFINPQDPAGLAHAFPCIPSPALMYIANEIKKETPYETYLTLEDGSFLSVSMEGHAVSEPGGSSILLNLLVKILDTNSDLQWLVDLNNGRVYHSFSSSPSRGFQSISTFVETFCHWYPQIASKDLKQFIHDGRKSLFSLETKEELFLKKHQVQPPSFILLSIPTDNNRASQSSKPPTPAAETSQHDPSKPEHEITTFQIESEGYESTIENFNYSPWSIFHFDQSGKILKANQTLFKKTRTSDTSKFIGKNIHEIYKDTPIYDSLREALKYGFVRYEGPFISYLNQKTYFVNVIIKKLAHGDIYEAVFEDITEKDYVQRVLNEVATISAHFNDTDFFNELVKLLGQKLNLTYCLVGEYVPHIESIQSIAVAKDGELIPNISYHLNGTPCYRSINDMEEGVTIVTDHAAELYPDDQFLKDESLVSYCSTGIKDKTGRKIGILVIANTEPIKNKNGLINIISILGDRVGAELQRMRYEKELLESQQLYKSIAENFPEGTVDVLDQHLKYIYTEGSEYKHIGIDPAELIGTYHLAKYDAITAARAKKMLDKVFAGKTVVYEINYNGEHYKKTGVPMKNESGEVVRALLVTQNISEAKKAEVEREKLIRDLSSHNEELQHFAYIVSHNLRAPIVNITSLLDLLNEDDLADPDNTELIESLKVSTSILNSTLMDLIEVVSIKKKKILKVEKIQFNTIVNNLEKSLYRQLKETKTKIKRDFHAKEINYVYSHLENFLLNFMTNAIKYSHPKREPEIVIKTEKVGNHCIITFSDNGIGIDLKKYEDRIFGLYQRFHTHVEGKGLGLYLIREQIRSLDGEINVTSEVGKGTSFQVTLRDLPLAVDSAQEAGKAHDLR